jgi:hypothetical protein
MARDERQRSPRFNVTRSIDRSSIRWPTRGFETVNRPGRARRAAGQLAREVSDDLQLVLDALGWGETGSGGAWNWIYLPSNCGGPSHDFWSEPSKIERQAHKPKPIPKRHMSVRYWLSRPAIKYLPSLARTRKDETGTEMTPKGSELRLEPECKLGVVGHHFRLPGAQTACISRPSWRRGDGYGDEKQV